MSIATRLPSLPFLGQWLLVIAATLAPVLLLTFLWLPITLEGHPGEARIGNGITPDPRHMS